MPRPPRFLVVFFASAAFFAFFLPWSGFNDPDAFYHAKISALLWQSGPIHSFPWLDLTLIGSHWADLHFLFHAFVAPFTAVFGMFTGLRLATILLAAIAMTVFERCLRWLGFRNPIVWTILLAISPPFLFRILLGKAFPFALIWFLLGLVAAWKRRPVLLAACTAGFALTHGGWPFLFGSVVLLAIGEGAQRLTHPALSSSQERDYVFPLRSEELKVPILSAREGWVSLPTASLLGGLLGMLLHPNASEIFRLWWTQVVTIGLGTPYTRVNLGLEWMPANPVDLLVLHAPWIIAVILGTAGVFLAPRKPLDLRAARFTVSFGLVFAAFVALTFSSRRNMEYLSPVLAVWCASLWTNVDARTLWNDLIAAFPHFGLRRGTARRAPTEAEIARQKFRIISLSSMLLGAIVISFFLFKTWTSIHPPKYPDTVVAPVMSEVSKRAVPGDRVFHPSWDEFPPLFAADDRLKYVSGLDPTFLLVASSTLSGAMKAIADEMPEPTKEAVWSLVHDRLDARFVFVEKKRNPKLFEVLKNDGRYGKIGESEEMIVYIVTPPAPA